MLAPRLELCVMLTASRSRMQWVDQSNARFVENVLPVKGSPWAVETKYLQEPPSFANHACLVKHTPRHTKPGPAKIATTVGRIVWPPKRARWRRRPSVENVKLGHTLSPCWACVSRVPSVVMTVRTLSSLSVKYPEYPQISSAVLHDQTSAANWWLLRVLAQ